MGSAETNPPPHDEAAELLRRLVAMIDSGELNAPAWYRERLIGAAVALAVPNARVSGGPRQP